MKSEKSRVATDIKRKCSHPEEGQSQTSRRAESRAKNAHVPRTFLKANQNESTTDLNAHLLISIKPSRDIHPEHPQDGNTFSSCSRGLPPSLYVNFP
jgi:hypothetical protein